MPNSEDGTVKVAELTLAQRYAILADDQKRNLREKMFADGCSKSSFHRWLADNAMPLIWQQKFNEHYNTVTNAN